MPWNCSTSSGPRTSPFAGSTIPSMIKREGRFNATVYSRPMPYAPKTRLRSIHVAAGLEADSGGPPVSVFNYTACSLAAGIEAEVATTHTHRLAANSLRPQIESRGVRVVSFRRAHFFGRYAARWGISYGLLKWMLANVKDYDIIVLH